MKRTVLLTLFFFIVIVKAKSQVILNELYTDPGSGRHEFFELFNTSTATSPFSMDDYCIITYFEASGLSGFYVMDLPNLNINPHSYFVGSSAIPFNFQGVTNSTNSDFSWNSSTLTSNNGYIKAWIKGTSNLLDGNLFYDQMTIPANFNDFFYRRTGSGASYTVFLYKNGTLINSFVGGSGGNATISNVIVNMPALYVDMVSPTSTDFTVNWSTYNSIALDYCTQDAGSDNGYIRDRDGLCGPWLKSSSSVQHTPKAPNGANVDATTGFVSVSTSVTQGNATIGSTVTVNVVAAPSTSMPVEMDIYLDNGTTIGKLDNSDTYKTALFETTVAQPAQSYTFWPYDANILVVVKSATGCLDKIIFIPNAKVLSVNLKSFQGSLNQQNLLLSWDVTMNEGGDRFELERSYDGKDFHTIGLIMNSEKLGAEHYAWEDHHVEGNRLFYRLKMIGKDQVVTYSRVLEFKPADTSINTDLVVVNNPVKDRLAIRFSSMNNEDATIRIYDMNGKELSHQEIKAYTGMNQVNLTMPSNITKGFYILSYVSGNTRLTSRFVKQ